jgi:hypothetical protein
VTMRSLEGGAVVAGVPGYQQALGRLASLFFEVLPRNVFFTPSGPFSRTRAPEAPVKPCFASAVLGGRRNGHGSALMIPVPRVLSETSLPSARQDQPSARPADLAYRDFLALQNLGPLVKFALMRG